MLGTVIAGCSQPTEIPGLRSLTSECEFEAEIVTQPKKPMLTGLICKRVRLETNFVKPEISNEAS
jgi:hypothetical protein